jgi:hypothetical protein
MRWLLLVVGLLIGASADAASMLGSPGGGVAKASIGFVAGNTHQCGSGLGATTCSVTITAAAGDYIPLTFGFAYGGGTITTNSTAFSDTNGDTCAVKVNNTVNSSVEYISAIGYCGPIAASGSQSFTATLTFGLANQNFLTIFGDRVTGASGVETVAALNTQISPPTSSNAVTSTAVTTTANGDLIYGPGISVSSTGLSTGTSPNVFVAGQAVSSTFYSEYFIQGSAGSIAATYTALAALDNTFAGIMAFEH